MGAGGPADGVGPIGAHSVGGAAHGSAPLLLVLWRRRMSVMTVVAACLCVAATYLVFATRIYSATAKVRIEQNGPHVYSDPQGFRGESESFLQTQADSMLATSVLSRALDIVQYHSLKTFAKVTGDPVVWLRESGALKVDAGRKSDVVTIAMESPYGQEAAQIADAVAGAFLAEQSQEQRTTGSEMVGVLKDRRVALQKEREEALAGMLAFQRTHGELMRTDKANTAVEHASATDTSLQQAEVATVQAKSKRDSIENALKDPKAISAFVEGQQIQAKEGADKELDNLRTMLNGYQLEMSKSIAVQGPGNRHVQALQTVIDSLKKQLADKERAIAEGELAAANSAFLAAQQQEQELRAALQKQTSAAADISSDANSYAQLDDQAKSLLKQIELIDSRITEISVNNISSPPLNITLMEQARPTPKPVKPNKVLIMAAALMLGWLLGVGLAMMREWQDVRLRTPEEVLALLGTPIIATVPRINTRLSSVARGQIVRLDARSAVAEAYRSIRTSLHLGAGAGGKTILVCSPTPGDGKSTTASNLALAFAQTGERTLLLDCDLREPVQHLIFEADGSIGVSSVMAGEVKLQEAIVRTRTEGLFVLPAGALPGNPSEMLASKRFKRLMAALAGAFDRIVIDSPPLLAATDARVLAASADATVMVVRMEKTSRQFAASALDGLESVGANVLGTIANDVLVDIRADYQYGGSWRYATRNERLLIAPDANKTRGGMGAVTAHLEATIQDANKKPAEAELIAINEPDWNGDNGQ
jgi:polysaccharide biosynthesis transport protein